MLNPTQIKSMTGIQDVTKLTELANNLNDTFEKYNIKTALRQIHFLAQILHESGNLLLVKENLNYSASGLIKTFKKYFPSELLAKQYSRNPEKIANRVYGNRMGNGDEASGDGYKFRGRGYIQLTGKSNYEALSKEFGIDFIKNPELLETSKYASLSAGWYWNRANLNKFADNDDILTITKKINGGVNGLDSRKKNLEKLRLIIK